MSKNIIIVIRSVINTETGSIQPVPEPWSNLKKLCIAEGWKYNTMSRKGNKFIKEGVRGYRLKIN